MPAKPPAPAAPEPTELSPDQIISFLQSQLQQAQEQMQIKDDLLVVANNRLSNIQNLGVETELENIRLKRQIAALTTPKGELQ